MRRLVFFLIAAAFAVFAYTQLAPRFLPSLTGLAHAPEKFTPAEAPRLDPKDLPGLAKLDEEYTRLVSSVVPSVVSINSTRTVRVPVADLSDYLFGWRGRVMERPESSLGSGVVVSKEGHILTNHHVVADMQDISVQFTDGREVPAQLIGSDANVDIALLKVDIKDPAPLPLADSDDVQVGQMVFAVGNPFGLQETVTRGIVSAKGRALRDSGVQFFQTDAAVNPGNSGGPLLNMRGEIVGINSAIYSQTGSWAGISFAIPANVARRTMDSLLKTGHPQRGTLGVNMVSLSPALAQRLGLKDAHGVYVADVELNSPAERAGLKRGDVIRTFNGQVVLDAKNMRDLIAATGVGAKVDLGIIRAGADLHLKTEIIESTEDANPRILGARRNGQTTTRNVLSDVKVAPLSAENRNGLPAAIQGMIVTGVSPNTPAASVLTEGDIIEEINKQSVSNSAEYEAAVQNVSPGERALIRIIRGRTRNYVVLNPQPGG